LWQVTQYCLTIGPTGSGWGAVGAGAAAAGGDLPSAFAVFGSALAPQREQTGGLRPRS